jgi:hypothetical protein
MRGLGRGLLILGALAALGMPARAVEEAPATEAAPPPPATADAQAAPAPPEEAATQAAPAPSEEAATQAAPAPPATAPAEPQTYEGRGVYYFEGSVESPLAGLGSRASHATNRLVLDDEHSVVTVDRNRHQIHVRNTHGYKRNALVGCLTLLGRGTTASGEEVPLGVHLKIHKSGKFFTARLHPHPTVRDEITSAVFEPFEVVLFNGKKEEVVLTPEQAVEAVRDPALTARLAQIFLNVNDYLEGVALTPEQPDARLVDLSIGFGSGRLGVAVVRVKLLSKSADNAPLVRSGALREMFERGEWEFRIESKSPSLAKSDLARDFFLFGIDDLPVLDPVKERGLRYGQALVVGFQDGKGYIGMGEERAEFADPAGVARAYMEFHFVGGVVARQVTQLPNRIE